jgi:hypothetical protein
MVELISIDDAATLHNVSPATIRSRIKVCQIKSCAVQVKRRMLSTGARFVTKQHINLYDYASLAKAIDKLEVGAHA